MSMTNEQMAELISKGGNDELLPLMWGKVRKLFRVISEQYYRKHLERCQSSGVTPEDLQQESYFAMLDAIKGFSTREDKALTFTSYCRFPFLSHAAILTGTRTARTRHDPINTIRKSLDEVLTNSEGEEAGSLGELIPDKQAESDLAAVDDDIYTEQLHAILEKALDKIPTKEAAIIRAAYWHGVRTCKLAKEYNVSEARISGIKREGFRHLRRIQELKELAEIRSPHTVSAQRQLLFGSIVEQEAERRERLRELLGVELSDKCAALLLLDYPLKETIASSGFQD